MIRKPPVSQLKQTKKSLAEVISEATLERRLVQAVKKAKGLVLKLPALWYIGIPDRLVLLPGGKLFFVELKVKKKKARLNQAVWIRKLRALGFQAGTVRGSEAMNNFIQKHCQQE